MSTNTKPIDVIGDILEEDGLAASYSHEVVTGEINIFEPSSDTLDGLKTYINFDKALLQKLTARPQWSQNTSKTMIVVSMRIVLEGLEIGKVDEDGNTLAHPMFTEERYSGWRRDASDSPDGKFLAKYIYGQKWVSTDQLANPHALAMYLQEKADFNLILPNPNNPIGNRETTDLFVARPVSYNDSQTTHGAELSSFVIDFNPTYDRGLRDFYSAMDDQMGRLERMHELANSDNDVDKATYAKHRTDFRLNGGAVGGVYLEQEGLAHKHRPRNVDISALVFPEADGSHRRFKIRSANGTNVSLDKLMSSVEDYDAKYSSEDTEGFNPSVMSQFNSLEKS